LSDAENRLVPESAESAGEPATAMEIGTTVNAGAVNEFNLDAGSLSEA
jgi:hypothetical protein